MSVTNVVRDLQSVCQLRLKTDETPEAFTKRLALKADAMADTDWETLEKATQLWVNSAVEAITKGTDIPAPSGLDEVFAEGEEAAPAQEEAASGGDNPGGENVAKKKKTAKKAPASDKAKRTFKGGAKRGPKGRFDPAAKIKLLAAENPHRKGAKDHSKYAKLKQGMHYKDALAAGVDTAYLRYMVDSGRITVG